MSEHDQDILDEAYSTTYKSTLRRLLGQAESATAKAIILQLIREADE